MGGALVPAALLGRRAGRSWEGSAHGTELAFRPSRCQACVLCCHVVQFRVHGQEHLVYGGTE